MPGPWYRGHVLQTETSQELFQIAQDYFPGGVNSPVRAFRSVGGHPLFIKKAKGAYLWDEDDNRYVDYVGSWGPAILGHADDEVLDYIRSKLSLGLSFGAPSRAETELAQMIQGILPSMEMMRFVSSGTEACMSAIRVARGFTKREKIIKFEGNYHGHGDMLLVKAGSGVATFGLPDSAGVTQGVAGSTLTAAYNNLAEVEALFNANPAEVAAVIIEPIVGNAGFIRPNSQFLLGLQNLCKKHGALLIFDEVMTGFRTSLKGVQGIYQIKPDLVTLGKVVGGGMPLAVYGGRREIMNVVAPLGPVYQAGTLSGNPIAVAAGLKTLQLLSTPGRFEKLSLMTRSLVDGMKEIARKHNVPFQADSEGGMFGFFFREETVRNYQDAKLSNVEVFKKVFHGMLSRGIYLAPSAFEAGFVSLAHTSQDISLTLDSFDHVLGNIK